MALWRISVKNSGNAACVNKSQKLEKGMSVETSTSSTTPPLGQPNQRPLLVQLFKSKYGIDINPSQMSLSYFTCERIG